MTFSLGRVVSLLQALDAARPPELGMVHPKLRQPQWRWALAGHSDQALAYYVLEGIIEHSFHVGFDHASSLVPSTQNMLSAGTHPNVITDYIMTELAAGKMYDPLTPPPRSYPRRTYYQPNGNGPERACPRKVEVDNRPLPCASVNNSIQCDLCSLRYTSVEIVATAAQRLGVGALLAKIYIKSMYHLVPVHPLDCPLLGVQ